MPKSPNLYDTDSVADAWRLPKWLTRSAIVHFGLALALLFWPNKLVPSGDGLQQQTVFVDFIESDEPAPPIEVAAESTTPDERAVERPADRPVEPSEHGDEHDTPERELANEPPRRSETTMENTAEVTASHRGGAPAFIPGERRGPVDPAYRLWVTHVLFALNTTCRRPSATSKNYGLQLYVALDPSGKVTNAQIINYSDNPAADNELIEDIQHCHVLPKPKDPSWVAEGLGLRVVDSSSTIR